MGTVQPSWNDIIEGGTGNDTMSGGRGADTFVFRAGEGTINDLRSRVIGTDDIYQFESWDTLQFVGFGYANGAAALSHMSQSDANVIFVDQGENITFHGTSLATLSAANFVMM
jgi:Ca2+-binding RTX toxin-like protein